MRVRITLLLIVLLSLAAFANAQQSTNGRGGSFHDKFLDGLVGEWKVKRSIRGQVADSTIRASWVLNHQFLRLDMTDGKRPSEYSAEIYIGYDDTKKSYVVHWIDTFGGSFSETLGYGKREGARIVFEFAYPDGLFRNTFTRDDKKDSWTFLMQSSDGKGGWSLFAEDKLTRRKRK